jgi:hypothetical protein
MSDLDFYLNQILSSESSMIFTQLVREFFHFDMATKGWNKSPDSSFVAYTVKTTSNVLDAEKYRQDDYFNANQVDFQSNETSSSLLQTDNPFLSDQL